MNVNFEGIALEQYDEWDELNKKLKNKIKALIKDIRRTPYTGIGKPEPLKDNLSGLWSRRINDEHRLVYKVENETLSIVSCKSHYQ
jgi:toxin YoeB